MVITVYKLTSRYGIGVFAARRDPAHTAGFNTPNESIGSPLIGVFLRQAGKEFLRTLDLESPARL